MSISMDLKKSVKPSEIPFVLSLSKGGRGFGRLTKRVDVPKAAHASTGSARTAFGTHQLSFLG